LRKTFSNNKEIAAMYRIPLVFTPQPEGGYTVTSPVLPELLTEGETLEEANAHVQDAFEAVLEIYAEQNRPLPAGIALPNGEVVWSEVLVASA
jgi:antitoxin HicB